MNKTIKQIVVVVAVFAISMVFIIQFRPGTEVQLGGGPTCAIEISGDCIPHSDFVTAYRLASPSVDSEILKQMRLREVVADGLVERWLLLADAERLGIAVASEDVVAYVGGNGMARFSLPAFREQQYTIILGRYLGAQLMPSPIGPARRIPVFDPKTNKFDYKRYQRWVARQSNKTEKDFKEFQRQEAVAARVRALVKARVRVAETEARARYAEANEKAVVDYIKVERSFYKDHVIDGSVDAVQTWRDANGGAVDEEWERRKDAFLPECRRTRHILARIDETDPDKDAAKTKASDKLMAAKARIDGGESFGAVAKDVSEDPNSAPEGGKLGCFAAGKLSKPTTTEVIDAAAFALKEGELSDVIESSHGLHLIIVDQIADAEAAEKIGKSLAARELYLNGEAERMVSEGAKQILSAVKDGKTLQAALDAHLDAVLPEAAKKAFEDKSEVDGEPINAWSDPARPQVKTSDPFTASLPPFSQVQNPPDASQKLFQLDKPGMLPDDVIKLYNGYAVAQLKERQPVDDKAWNEQRVDYMAAMRREKQADALAAYMARLREQYAKEISYRIKLTEDEESQEGG